MTKTYYQVTFRNAEKPLKEGPTTVKVKEVSDSSLGLGFVCLKDFVFEESSLIVDPTLEGIRTRYENTKALHLNIHNIVSIEEVGADHQGLSFNKDKSNLLIFGGENSPQSEQ